MPRAGSRIVLSLFMSFAIFGVACAVAGVASTQTSRQDVPVEFARRENPTAHLTPAEQRYYQKQFKTKCARCHGRDGDGGGLDAGAQQHPPRDFTDAPFMRSRTDGQLFYQILMGGGARSAMPAYGPDSDHAWSEEKIWRMVRFVRGFSN